jgi:hypothetical protein
MMLRHQPGARLSLFRRKAWGRAYKALHSPVFDQNGAANNSGGTAE